MMRGRRKTKKAEGTKKREEELLGVWRRKEK
jgi:hypothetical protein